MVRGRKNRGFSLIEVMTSAVIVSIGVMAAVKVYSAGAAGRALSYKKAMAMKLVDQRIDTLDTLGANHLPQCRGVRGCRDSSGDLVTPRADAGSYPCTQVLATPSVTNRHGKDDSGGLRIDTTVWQHPDSEQWTDAQMVMVSACWKDRFGRVQEYRAQRLVLVRGE